MDYAKSQKVIHWLMAFLIMLDLFVAQKFGSEMELWDRLESRVDHATVGLIVSFLFIIRLFLRYKYGAPSLPISMPRWQMLAAHLGHYGLYFLMGGLILTGIISASFASNPIIVFGAFDLAFSNHSEESFIFIRTIHEFCTNAIIVLILIHILAAVYHHYIAKDDTTLKMLKFWSSKVQK